MEKKELIGHGVLAAALACLVIIGVSNFSMVLIYVLRGSWGKGLMYAPFVLVAVWGIHMIFKAIRLVENLKAEKGGE